MSVALDFYVHRDSWLHRLDPRVKLWGMLVGFVAAFLLPYVRGAGRAPAGIAPASARQSYPLECAAPFVAADGAVDRADPGVTAVFRSLRRRAGGRGAAAADGQAVSSRRRCSPRARSSSHSSSARCCSPPINARSSRPVVRLGLPYTWGLTFSLTLRFLPAIQQLFVTVREAQAARGWVAEGNLFRRFRNYLPVLVAVIIGTLRMSDRLTLALAARGMGPGANTGSSIRTAHRLARPADAPRRLADVRRHHPGIFSNQLSAISCQPLKARSLRRGRARSETGPSAGKDWG